MEFRKIIFLTILLIVSVACFSNTLQAMNKTQIERNFLGNSMTGITVNTNGIKTRKGLLILRMNSNGTLSGKSLDKKPTVDTGSYSIQNDGTFYFQWRHWYHGEKICGRMLEVQNAFIVVDCNNAFQVVYMKTIT